MSSDSAIYRHRVRPTIWVWLFMVLVTGSLGVAAGAVLGSWAGWLLFVGSSLVPVTLLVRSTVTIEVSQAVLRVDRATLPLEFAGAVTVLDAEAARRQRGPELDPACHLVLRGWIPTAVRIENIDPADPVPYWYLSTADPVGLSEAIERSRS
jgi:hypothetical protein